MSLDFYKNHLYILFLFFCVITNAQNNEIDRLLKELKANEKNDTLKVNTLNDLAWEFRKIDAKKALSYGTRAKEISKEISFKRGFITSNVRLGTIAIYEKRMEDAKSIFLQVLEDEKGEEYVYGIGRAQNQLGRIYKAIGDLDQAIKYYKGALESFDSLQKKPQIALVNNNIGVLYKQKGEYDTAIQYYLNSLKIRKELNDRKRSAYTLSNIGALHIEIGDYAKAIEFLNESGALLEEFNLQYELSKVYTNLGVAFFKIKKETEALENYQKAIGINETIGFTNKNINIFNNIGSLYYQLGNLTEASSYYKKSLAEQEKNNFNENKAATYCSLGNVEYKREAYNQAIEYYQKSKSLAKSFGNTKILLESENNLSLSYYMIKEFDKAFKHSSTYSHLKDSIDTASKRAIITTSNFLEEQLEMDLLVKEKQIVKSQLEKEQLKKFALIGVFFLLIIILGAIIRGNQQKRKADLATIERQKVEELLKNQEMKSINAMIEGQEGERQRIARDLHDRLGSILSMVKVHFKSVEDHIEELKTSNKSQYEKANQLLDDACDEVRKISHNIASGVLTKFGLVAALEDLKETLEESKKIKVEFIAHGLYDRLDNEVEITIYRIIQELISNILKHAEAENITIQIMNRENDLHISVEDDGKGFDANKKEDEGMGLKNVMTRVDSLDGELYIDSMIDKGTSISISIPNKEI